MHVSMLLQRECSLSLLSQQSCTYESVRKSSVSPLCVSCSSDLYGYCSLEVPPPKKIIFLEVRRDFWSGEVHREISILYYNGWIQGCAC